MAKFRNTLPPITQRGFTLLELVLVIAIVAVLMATAYSKYEGLAEQAEKAAFTGVLGNTQAALTHAFIRSYLDDDQARWERQDGINPIQFLAKPPINYGGVTTTQRVTESALPGQHWYFLEDTGELAYKVKRNARLRLEHKHRSLLKFRIELVRSTPESGKKETIEGVLLTAVDRFSWEP